MPENTELLSQDKEITRNPYFEVLALGVFGKEKIVIKQNPPEQYSEEQEKSIEGVWQARNEARLAKGQGPLESTTQLKLKSATVLDHQLKIEVTEGTYKDHIAMQDKDFRSQFPDFDPKIIGTNIVVRTKDGKLMVVQRGMSSATKPGAMSVVGGQWDITKDCDEKGVWDPFKTITRELEEETGIKREEIDNLVATGVIYNKAANNPSLIFYADSSLLSDQIRQRVGDGEVSIKFISEDQKEIEKMILWWAFSPSPSGASALALYGKELYGQEWFNWIQERLSRRNEKLYSKMLEDKAKVFEQRARRRLSKL